jgi:tRNA pseudouridine38-40 synthase
VPHCTLLTVAYDGTDFAGCQVQGGQRTVHGVLAEAMGRVHTELVDLEILSRTDAGVHARGNLALVIHLEQRDPKRFATALNLFLPPDLRVVEGRTVQGLPPVGNKHYSYLVDTTLWADPLRARFAWRPTLPLAGPPLARMARLLEGEHDFEAFRRRGETRASLVRRIERAQWTPIDQGWRFDIMGQGFPYRLVRSLVGSMIYVARNHATEAQFAEALAGTAGPLTQQLAPARGLCLERIELG